MGTKNFTMSGPALVVAAMAGAYGAIPSSLGWYEIPNTKLQAVCPSNDFGGFGYPFADRCASVTLSWNGGAFDPSRNRMIIWGGGHQDYSGNEMYALDLTTLQVKRLTDPAQPAATGDCPEGLAGGTQPNSRHTYNGLAYMKNADRFFVVGGSKATCGYMSTATWTFDFKTNLWQLMNPSGAALRGDPGIVAVYDDNSGNVFVHDAANLYSYDFAKNAYTVLLKDVTIDYHLTGAIDTKRKKLVLIGHGEQWIIDISGSGYKQEKLGSTGGDAVVGKDYPGFTYDPSEDRLVAWQGGNSAYALNMDTKTWTEVSFPNGPGPSNEWGTLGRWEYVPSVNGFVVVNQVKQDAFVFKWSAKAVSVQPKAAEAKPAKLKSRKPVVLFQDRLKGQGASEGASESFRDANGRVFPLPAAAKPTLK